MTYADMLQRDVAWLEQDWPDTEWKGQTKHMIINLLFLLDRIDSNMLFGMSEAAKLCIARRLVECTDRTISPRRYRITESGRRLITWVVTVKELTGG